MDTSSDSASVQPDSQQPAATTPPAPDPNPAAPSTPIHGYPGYPPGSGPPLGAQGGPIPTPGYAPPSGYPAGYQPAPPYGSAPAYPLPYQQAYPPVYPPQAYPAPMYPAPMYVAPAYPPPTFEAMGRVQLNVGSLGMSRTSSWAIASIACVIVGLFTGIGFIAAIVFGHLALNEIKEKPYLEGRGLALAGLGIGYSVLGLGALVICGYFVVFLVFLASSGHTTLLPFAPFM